MSQSLIDWQSDYDKKGLQASEKLANIQKLLGYQFQNQLYLLRALTHRSALIFWQKQRPQPSHNEALEYLGDSLLNFVVSRELFFTYPHVTEGQLSRARSLLVGTKNLLKISSKLQISRFLFLGPSEQKKSAHQFSSNLPANAVEALIAALFLDGQFLAAEKFVKTYWNERILDGDFLFENQEPKSALQHFSQKTYGSLPEYQVIHESNDGLRSHCIIEVWLNGQKRGLGEGKNKQEASVRAAINALKALKS